MCSTCSTSAALLGWEGSQLTACSASMRRAKQTQVGDTARNYLLNALRSAFDPDCDTVCSATAHAILHLPANPTVLQNDT